MKVGPGRAHVQRKVDWAFVRPVGSRVCRSPACPACCYSPRGISGPCVRMRIRLSEFGKRDFDLAPPEGDSGGVRGVR